jgi:hypothetical protein
MRNRIVVSLVGLLSLLGGASMADPLGAAFTYQGKLADGNSAVSGIYDLRFTLYDALSGGAVVGSSLTNAAASVSNGLFTVTLDFGTGAFTGNARWLEIGVRTNGSGVFIVLAPRQPLTPAPYALFALTPAGPPGPPGLQGAAGPTGATGAQGPTGPSTTTNNTFYIGSDQNANQANSTLAFGTDNRTNLILLENGNVGIGRANPATTLDVNGTVTATNFAGNGAGLTNLNSAQLTGTVPLARLPGAVVTNNGTGLALSGAFSGNGNALTNLNAAQLAGTISSNNIAAGTISAAKLAAVSNWFMLTMTNPTMAADTFGYSVAAVGSDRVLVGAPGNDRGATDAGAAYLLSTSGLLLATFTNPAPTAYDLFGGSLAALGTDRILIGAPQDSTSASFSGSVYLFNTSGALLTTFANPTPAPGEIFGSTLAVVGSELVLISANENTGTVYLFNTNGTLLTTITNPAPAVGDNFGVGLAAFGSDRVLVGASYDDLGVADSGTAYLFSTNGTLLTTFTNPTPGTMELFGFALAPLGTDRVLIGAHGHNGVGAAYLFTTNGLLLTTFSKPTTPDNDYFGYRVLALGTDRVLISADNESTAAPSSGVVYLFTTNGTFLTAFTNPAPATYGYFGCSVAALGTDRFLIGAMNNAGGAGAAYLYTMDNYNPGLIAQSVRGGSVTTASLADGAVTSTKISGALLPSQIPDLDASKVASGTLADTRLSANVALLNANQVFAGSNRFAGVVTLTNPANAMVGAFTGNGSGLTNLNASQLAAGTVPLGQLPGAVVTNNATSVALTGAFTGNGNGLTNLNASQLAAGTVPLGQLPGAVVTNNAISVALTGAFTGNGNGLTNLSASQLAAGTVPLAQLPGVVVTNNATSVALIGTFTGNGNDLTNLNASQLAAGTVPMARLPGAVVTNNAASVALTGAFTGNGSGLTNLNAGQLSTGTVPDARLSANVALLNDNQSFSGTNLFSQRVGIGTTSPGQLLQVGDATIPGSQGMIRFGSRAPTNANYRTWDIGVPQTGSNTSGIGYSFVINDKQLGADPEFLIRFDTGFVGIGRTNPATALDVNGTVTATAFAGNVPGAVPWETVAGTSQTAAPDQGYLLTNNAQVTVTLPASAVPGEVVRVSGGGAGGWKLAQNSGQSILVGNLPGTESSIGAVWTAHASISAWQSIACSADGAKLVAACPGFQLYTSIDGGVNWTPRDSSRSWYAVASSANGVKLAGAVHDGQLYTSTDSGATWAAHGPTTNWTAVASSADGVRLVAAGAGSQIFVSSDSGTNWTPHGVVTNYYAVASSADGTRLGAAASSGQIYVSTDSGATWIARASRLNWHSLACSADGTQWIAAAYGGQVYTSSDSGINWTAHLTTQNWNAVASSADGTKLAAGIYGGQIYLSSDSGVTWTPRASGLGWYSIASSADGTKLAACAYSDQIYTSVPSTSLGAAGYLIGGQYSAIELQALGNAVWIPLSYIGTISAY